MMGLSAVERAGPGDAGHSGEPQKVLEQEGDTQVASHLEATLTSAWRKWEAGKLVRRLL